MAAALAAPTGGPSGGPAEGLAGGPTGGPAAALLVAPLVVSMAPHWWLFIFSFFHFSGLSKLLGNLLRTLPPDIIVRDDGESYFRTSTKDADADRRHFCAWLGVH